jgi:NitT/TauT family transport system permease protein
MSVQLGPPPSASPADVAETPTFRASSWPEAAPVSEAALRRRRSRRRRRALVWTLRALVLVVVIGGWQLFTSLGWVDDFTFSRPTLIASRIWRWLTVGTAVGPLYTQVLVTMEETVLGFGVGVILGIIFGISLARIRLLAEVLGPYIKAANAIPRIVLGSIFIIWLGFGLAAHAATATVLVFFVVFFNAFQGVREVDGNLLANARILGASRRQTLTHVVIPSAMTWIIASLHVAFGLALIGAIVGEFLGSSEGLGYLIMYSQGTFSPDGVFAAIVILAAVALVAEGLVTWLENRLINWRPQRGTESSL